MAKNTMTMFKGIGTGMAAGIMVGAVSALMLKDSKKSKKTLNKAIQAFEDVLDKVQGAFA